MTHLLSPTEIDQLKGLRFSLPKLLEKGQNGRHQASQKGSSVEFSQHRDYAPGDPIRHLDWKAYARSEKYVIKEFESESNLQVLLVLDRSVSMEHRDSDSITKFAYGCQLIHGLTWLLLQQGDAVGLVSFSNDEPTFLPPSGAANQIHQIEHQLTHLAPHGKTSFKAIIEFINIHCRRNTVCVFISDLLDDEHLAEQKLVQLKQSRFSTYCLHLLSEGELRLSGDDPTLFQDPETSEILLSEPQAIRVAYAKAIDEWLANVHNACTHHGIAYAFTTTSTPPVQTLYSLMGYDAL